MLTLHAVALAVLWWQSPALVARTSLPPPMLRVVYAAPVLESLLPPPAPQALAADRPAATPHRIAPPTAPARAPAPAALVTPSIDAPASPQGLGGVDNSSPAADPVPADTPAQPAAPAASAPRPAPAPAAPAPRAVPPSAVSYRVPPPVQVPLASRRLGEAGTVWLKVWVDAAGLPRQVSLHRSSGHPRLDEQALWAMGQARFRPQTDHGVPIEWVVIAPIAYELE